MDIDDTQKIIPSVNERDIFDEVTIVAETFRTSETLKKTFDFPADQIDARINTFVQIHRSISERLKEIEEDAVINESIDLELISEFKLRAIDSWNNSSTIKKLIKKIDKYEERPDVNIPDDLEAFGFNHLGPKAAFINQNKIHFNDLGEGLGRNLGMSEDIRLSELLIESLPTVKTNEVKLDDTIYQNLNNLRAGASNPILLCSRLNITKINKSRHYKPARNADTHELKDIDGFNGTFDGAAIINIMKLGDQNILLLDLNHFPKLVQYRFEKGSEYPLSITIEPMDEKTADKLLTDQPALLIDKGSGEKIEREKAIRDLLQKVHLQIWEKSRIEEMNSIRGVRIQLEE